MAGRTLKALVASFALLATVSAAPNSTPWSDGIPPIRFQGITASTVVFLKPAVVREVCSGSDKPPPGMQIIACTSTAKKRHPIVVLPLPCDVAATDYYARIVCHELAHVRGWPATHGD